jgi:hypothetical protein
MQMRLYIFLLVLFTVVSWTIAFKFGQQYHGYYYGYWGHGMIAYISLPGITFFSLLPWAMHDLCTKAFHLRKTGGRRSTDTKETIDKRDQVMEMATKVMNRKKPTLASIAHMSNDTDRDYLTTLDSIANEAQIARDHGLIK